MFGAQLLLLCFVDAYDAPRLIAALTAAKCGAVERFGRGGILAQGRVGLLIFAAPGEIPLVLATIRGTCARRVAMARAHATLTAMMSPLAEEVGGAMVFALQVRNSARWAFGDGPGGGGRRWEMLDAAILEAEAISPTNTQPTRLLMAVVPDRAIDRTLAALAGHKIRAMVVGSTGGFFRSGNTTIVADIPAEQAQIAAETIRAACVACHEADTAEQGIAFALDVAWQVRL